MATVRVYYGEELGRYGFGGGHPFGPDRLDAFWHELTREGLAERVELASPVLASEAELARFHTADYIRFVRERSRSGAGYLDYGDTPAFAGVFEAAAYVVGSTLDAVAHVLGGAQRRAFVPIAGLHHARRDHAAGFCVFNDIAVAIETLREVHGIRRIGYVDIDAHHGDGVYYAYADDPDLYIADIHEDGRYLYPGTGGRNETGEGSARGSKLNLPLPPGADEEAFRHAWVQVEALLRAHPPQLILLQAGADSVGGDPLTHLQFSPACHRYAAERLSLLADELCGGRLVATGGGGYNRANLGRAWSAVVAAMLA